MPRPRKCAFVTGPYHELGGTRQHNRADQIYGIINRVHQQVFGKPACIAHEEMPFGSDIAANKVAQKRVGRICDHTTMLIAVCIGGSWSGGEEVHIAHCENVPILLVCPTRRLNSPAAPYPLLDESGTLGVVEYARDYQLEERLTEALRRFRASQQPRRGLKVIRRNDAVSSRVRKTNAPKKGLPITAKA